MSQQNPLPIHLQSKRRNIRFTTTRKFDPYLLLLLLPGLLYFILFKLIPLFGIVIAFQDYSPFLGFFKSTWVGFANFERIFQDVEVIRVLWNTLYISFIQIVFVFPIPIVLAVMLNEVANQKFKLLIQSVVYLPHFISWVIVVGIMAVFLKSEGVINNIFVHFGLDWIPFLTNPHYFVPLIILELIWKETGWNTIIFLAALSAINTELLEAAVMDGANRWRKIWHIILPSIRNTIIILLILRLGTVLDSGFEQIFLMLNPFNMEVGNVLDTYVYYKGIQQGDFSFSTAVGLFKGIVGMLLVISANRLAKRAGEDGLY